MEAWKRVGGANNVRPFDNSKSKHQVFQMRNQRDVHVQKNFPSRRSIPAEMSVPIGRTDARNKTNIFSTLVPIYHMSKICGLLPVKFTRNKSGMYLGKVGRLEKLYGFCLALTLTGCMCWGLFRDLKNGWENSSRLNSEAAVIITCSDVFTVMFVVLVAILGSTYRWGYLQAALDKLISVDEKIGIPPSRSLRKTSIIGISCTYSYLLIISILDFISWKAVIASKNNHRFGDKGPMNYSPLYFMYVVIVTFQMQYALVLYNVGGRFTKLNSIIEKLNQTEEVQRITELDLQRPRNAFVQNIPSIIDLAKNRHRRTNKRIVSSTIPEKEAGDVSETIDQLISSHGILCDSVDDINKAYGGAILASSISCLLHLIITPYFLYSELQSELTGGWYSLVLQVFWILFHIYRLLLFIQPSHSTNMQEKTTKDLVSWALAGNWIPRIEGQLRIFSMQLLQRPVDFTASGLFMIDRTLLTSIASAVTTYLVILVQFQEASETAGTKNLLKDTAYLLSNSSTLRT